MDNILDFDGAVDRLSAWKWRVDRLAADTQTMSDRLQQLRVTVADDDRVVGVALDSAGILVDLHLSPKAQQMASDALARAIMHTVRLARVKLAERSQEIIVETLGTESPAAREIATRVGQRLRPPESTVDGERR